MFARMWNVALVIGYSSGEHKIIYLHVEYEWKIHKILCLGLDSVDIQNTWDKGALQLGFS